MGGEGELFASRIELSMRSIAVLDALDRLVAVWEDREDLAFFFGGEVGAAALGVGLILRLEAGIATQSTNSGNLELNW